MKRRRFVLCAALGLAAVLLAGNSVKAQGYFLGYYFPDEKRWSGPRIGTGISHVKDNTGIWNPVHQRAGTMTPNTPIMTQPTTSTSMRLPIAQPVSQVNVRVIVPHENAQVWFGDYQTKSTGMERVFQTPALQPGTYSYTVKIAFAREGQQISNERTVTVTPGQDVLVDFSIKTAKATAP